MMGPRIEIQLIAAVTAAACALPGVFLVLRRMSLMSDAVSHAILPGIVVGFLIVGRVESPILIAGAAATGILTVGLTELLKRTRLVKEDAAIGAVFPVLFSIGVILVARFASDVHLDADAVLLGELAFAPFDRLVVGGTDIGPRSLYTMGGVLVINALAIVLFYKELKLSTFDPGLAAALGFLPGLLHYGLMALVSMTAVTAFDSVGSILVVALMIAPPAAAYLLTDRLDRMILLSLIIGAGSAIAGYWLARVLDASIAGSMATMAGIGFAGVYLLSPSRGLFVKIRRRKRQRLEFAVDMLVVHLLHHTGADNERMECSAEHLLEHINWSRSFAATVARRAERFGTIQDRDSMLSLTEPGERRASAAMTR